MPFTTTVITGATSGIGRETALALAKKDHAVYMLVRDTVKGEEVRDKIIEHTKNKNIYVVHCDLSDLRSVRDAAELLKGSLLGINNLINNAGGIFPEYQKSIDGHEMTFAINHLGHFLLTYNLLPVLIKGQARVINISSEAHRAGKPNFKDLNWKKRPYSAYTAYGTAKLFNIFFTKSLATKFGPKGISSFAVHPGLVNTQFGAGLGGFGKLLLWALTPFMLTAEQGAQTPVYLATASRVDAKSGGYFKKRELASSSLLSANEDHREKLWELSMNLVAAFTDE